MYLAIKHLHVACVVISGFGFFIRGVLMLLDSPLLQARWMRIVPHINDTILLGAALTLAAMSAQYPFVEAWITAKVVGLVAYIILGFLALKAGRPKAVRVVCWGLALVVFGYIVSVARSRTPVGFLAAWIG